MFLSNIKCYETKSKYTISTKATIKKLLWKFSKIYNIEYTKVARIEYKNPCIYHLAVKITNI